MSLREQMKFSETAGVRDGPRNHIMYTNGILFALFEKLAREGQ